MLSSRRVIAMIGVVICGVAAPPLQAQYFGQNKVQYRSFAFQVLKTKHFDVYFYPEERQAATQAARMAERWYARLATFFHHDLSGRQPLILYASHPEFEQTNTTSGQLGEGTGGFTEPLKRRIVLPLAGTIEETNHVIGHELVHAFQYDITGHEGRMNSRLSPGVNALPLWFTEGMAEYLSKGPNDPLTAMWMRTAIESRFPKTFGDVDDPRYFPYRFGQALLAYVGGTWGDDALAQLLRRGGRIRDLARAVDSVLRVPPDTLVARWRASLEAANRDLASVTDRRPDRSGWSPVTGLGDSTTLNLAPVLSPDGQSVMYLSSRDLFSVELYYASAKTGAIRTRLTNSALDPHFQSLEFINSAGAWSGDGHRFAFAGVSHGRPMISIWDVDRRAVSRELHFDDLGEIFNPTWSPDGHSIAFSGLIGGLTDLFVVDLDTGNRRRLTHDAWADLHPAWSPDGRRIAFTTDRYSANLKELAPGHYRLAYIDPVTKRITPAPSFPDADNVNPEWAPDGQALYFVANRDGIANVYRADLARDTIGQVTDLYSGVSGITPLSPALSVASKTGTLAISVFNGDGYDIYRREASQDGATLAATPRRHGDAAILPPVARHGEEVLSLQANPVDGLPASDSFPVHPYDGDLHLDYVAPPTFAFGADQFGTYVGGGTALYFGDLLGRKNLVTGLQVNGGLKDIAAQVGYTSLAHRANWAIEAQQQPIRTGAFAVGTDTVNGQGALVQQSLLYRQTYRQLSFGVSYPFNRFDRAETWVAYQNIGFDIQQQTRAYSLTTGQLLINDKQNLPAPSSLNLGQMSAALVHDNAILGATSPLKGSRARLEITPTIGSLTFATVLGDAREYLTPFSPVTVAARIMHYGRYGGDAEDRRLAPLFLGYQGLVRGYTIGSFSANECHPTAADPQACPAFDQLVGSRILVGNLEVRAPLFRLLGIGSGYYGGPLPTEIALFADGGWAWDNAHPLSLSNGGRRPVFSTGVALRVNLLGFAVVEGALVRPLDRPDKGWMFQLSLVPGF